MATVTTVAKREKKEVPVLTNEEYKDKLKEINKCLEELVELAMFVADAKANKVNLSTDPTSDPNGASRKIGKRTVNQLESQLKSQIRDLGRYYVEASKKRRRKPAVPRDRKPGTGLDRPVFISSNMRNFFDDASKVGGSLGDIRQLISPTLLENGVTTRDILSRLWTLYRIRCDLNSKSSTNKELVSKGEDIKKSFHGADTMMKTHFAETFKHLSNLPPYITESEQNKVKKEAAKGKTYNPVKTVFNPDDFSFTDFSKLNKYNIMTPDGMITEKIGLYQDEEQDITNPAQQEALSTDQLESLEGFVEALVGSDGKDGLKANLKAVPKERQQQQPQPATRPGGAVRTAGRVPVRAR